jgi:hypothetical protein
MTTISSPRLTWMALEPIHAIVYFSPLGEAIYAASGLIGRQGYFASRSAALGAASPELVRSTFFNFSPQAVEAAIPSAWANTSPAEALQARHEVVRQTLAKFGAHHVTTDATRRAAAVARTLAGHAVDRLDGRPLFAAHAALPWPSDDEPAMVLWHAQTLMREFRGDGHIAALVTDGLTGLEAHITHLATGQMPVELMRQTRAWPADVFDAAVAQLVSRGLIQPNTDGSVALTEAGAAQRDRIENLTDALAAAPYDSLGEVLCRELRIAARPLAEALVEGGLSPMRRLPPADE